MIRIKSLEDLEKCVGFLYPKDRERYLNSIEWESKREIMEMSWLFYDAIMENKAEINDLKKKISSFEEAFKGDAT